MRIKITKVLQFDRTDVTKYEHGLLIWWKKLWGSYCEPLKMYKYNVKCEAKLIDVFNPIFSTMILKGSNYWKVKGVFSISNNIIYNPLFIYTSTAFSPSLIVREQLLGDAIAVCKS